MRPALFYSFVIGAFIALFCGISIRSEAQQDPQFSHYMFNEMNFNPAFAGNNRRQICANFLQHSQWTGFGAEDGGSTPTTQFFNASAPLSNKYVQGVGLSVFNDQVGFSNTVSIQASGSHQIETEFGRLSLGLSAGIIQSTLNGEELNPFEPKQRDVLIPAKDVSNMIFDLGFGAYLQAQNYFGGISVLHIPQGDLGWYEDGASGNSKYNRHYYLTGGYNYQLNEKWDVIPSALLKYDANKLQTDLNGRAVLNDKYWGGLGYRLGEKALTAMVGAHLTPQLKVGYSFDLSLQPNDVRAGGTHEILVGYCFNFNPQPKEEFPIWSPRFL